MFLVICNLTCSNTQSMVNIMPKQKRKKITKPAGRSISIYFTEYDLKWWDDFAKEKKLSRSEAIAFVRQSYSILDGGLPK